MSKFVYKYKYIYKVYYFLGIPKSIINKIIINNIIIKVLLIKSIINCHYQHYYIYAYSHHPPLVIFNMSYLE